MSELIKLEVECLKNMPMMLDAISNTINKLDSTFHSEHKNLEEYLKQGLEGRYNFYEDSDIGIFHAFAARYWSRKRKNPIKFGPGLSLCYTISFEKRVRTKLKPNYEVDFGYFSNNEKNYIFFRFYAPEDETSTEYISLKKLFEKLIPNIKEDWACEDESGFVGIEFDIDDDVSIEKIRQYCEAFKTKILAPIIKKLQT